MLSIEEIEQLTNEELYELVCRELRVVDSELDRQFKSKLKAEYLERQLFLCPKCNKIQTLYSKGNLFDFSPEIPHKHLKSGIS